MRYEAMTNLFSDADIIDMYSDDEAITDGSLVDITQIGFKVNGLPVTRMTRNLWNAYEAQTEVVDDGEYETFPNIMPEIAASLAAKREYERDTDGDGYLIVAVNVWYVRNETGGYTVMLPEGLLAMAQRTGRAIRDERIAERNWKRLAPCGHSVMEYREYPDINEIDMAADPPLTTRRDPRWKPGLFRCNVCGAEKEMMP